MNKRLAIFAIVFLIYFGLGTQWTFKVPLDLDHFNPLAKSLIQGQLDIPEPATIYDLAFYQGHWYPYWGPLPALMLIPIHLIMARFIPLFYFNVFIGSLNVVVIYLLLERLRREFLPRLSNGGVLLATLLFAFGTTHFYLGVNCGVWHTAQIVSFFPAALGIYLIFKKRRTMRDYFLSSFFISMVLLGRPVMIALLAVPVILGLSEKKKRRQAFFALALPFVFFVVLFGFYNYLRFGQPWETGYRYVVVNPHYQAWIEKYGVYSLAHLPRNLWHMIFSLPRLVFKDGVRLLFDLDGDSIFYLSPPLIAAFLALPRGVYKTSLWLALLGVALPILMIYSTGWIQFGYRYSLDFMVPLLLLSVFGVKGRINVLYFCGTVFAVWMHYLGITALQ